MISITDKNGNKKVFSKIKGDKKTPQGISIITIKEQGGSMEERNRLFEWTSTEGKEYHAKRYKGQYKEIEIYVFQLKSLNQWLCTCYCVGFLTAELNTESLEEAKEKAEKMVIDKIKKLYKLVEGV